jgi:NitT/TauT family transport system substrate-binding protein
MLALLAACGAPATQPAGPVTLRIAVLPVIDALPMYVAQQEGLFEQQSVQVEFLPVQSAPERDQIVAAGQADGMVNELLSTMFYNKDSVRVQTIRYAHAATPQTHLFSILAAGNSDINTVTDLKNVEIGVSQGTVIEYLTDRLLEAEGLSPQEITNIAVPGISDRMALLGSGELKAAMLPEPLTSVAVLQGARVVIDDSAHPQYSFSTLSFRKEVLDQNPQAIRGFLSAVEEAVNLINQEPAKWKTILAERELIPPPVLESFQVPSFVSAGVPTKEQWDDTLNWAKSKGLIDQDLSYNDSVTTQFLPE